MNTMRETNWCNSYWRHFENRGSDGSVKKEVFLSEGGRMITKTHWLGGLFTTEKETRVDPGMPGAVVNVLR